MSRRSRYVLGGVPSIKHRRSKFDLSYSHKTTGNVGDLLPLYLQEVYPGDSFKCDANVVIRTLSPFLKPVIDNLFCDVYFFYVPSRTVFDNWAEIFGENNDNAWARKTSVQSPHTTDDDGANQITSHDLSAYLGLPIGATPSDLGGLGGISILPFRAYAKVYNEWFRDENLIDPMLIQKGGWSSRFESLNGNDFSPSNYTGKPAKVSKMHDYFTSVVPQPQKGDAVDLINFTFDDVPVYPIGQDMSYPYPTDISPMRFRNLLDGTFVNGDLRLHTVPAQNPQMSIVEAVPDAVGEGSNARVAPTNLKAKTSQLAANPVTVNEQRFLFQYQKMLERDAVFGTRFTEYIQGHFGVTSPDMQLQRSEFLGGKRIPLNVIQTTQTSSTASNSPLGNVAAWSLSNGRCGYTKGFTEHGFVIGMFCVRQFHTYQQGVERFWWRKNRVDYLDPLFQNIGYQPVYTKELYVGDGSEVSDDTVFGYAPNYEDLRVRNNRISGQLASAAGEGLDIWHFGDDYANVPVLGQEFIEETSKYVDRALSVPSTTVDNFLFDVYFKQYGIRCLSTFGEPGLVDHH